MLAFDVLDKDLDVFESRLIEASAGTGKTFAIEHLFVRYLLEGVSFDQIVVMTFTKKATYQMRARIRANIKEAILALEREDPLWPYLLRYFDEKEEKVFLLKRALLHFEQVNISTIHSFCHKFLAQDVLGARLSLDMSDEPQGLSGFQKLLVSYLALSGSELLSFEHWLTLLEQRYHWDESALLDMAQKVAFSKYPLHSPHYLDEQQIVERIRAAFSFANYDSDQVLQKLIDRHGEFKRLSLDGLEQKLQEGLGNIFKQQRSDLKALKWALETFQPSMRKKAFLETSFPELDILAALKDELLPSIDALLSGIKSVLALLTKLQSKAEKMKEQTESFSPDDLLWLLHLRLQDPSFLMKARSKQSVAIIDEFQDTDPIQWEIFKKLFLNQAHLVLVGDPKQSIYAFRQADIYTYLEAKQLLAHRGSLQTNYRSTASLVGALNKLFKQVPYWMDLPKKQMSLEIPQVKAAASLVEGSGITFVDSSSEKQLWNYYLCEISKHLQSGIEPGEIAFLVSDRYQGLEVQKKLLEAGLSAKTRQGESLVESALYDYLKHLLEELCSKEPSQLFILCLKEPILGIEEQLLERFSSDLEEDLLFQEAYFCLRASWHEALMSSGFTKLYHQLMQSQFPGENKTVELKLYEQDPKLFYQWQQLCLWLAEQECQKGLSPKELLEELKRAKSSAQLDPQRLRFLDYQDQTSIQILTQHASKGLEYEVVFAVGVANRVKQSYKDNLVLVENEGSYRLHLEQSLSESEKKELSNELDAEKARLLYVSLTRAKRKVYVSLPSYKRAPSRGKASPLELFMARFMEESPSSYELLYERIKEGQFDAFYSFLGEAHSDVEYLSPQCLQTLPEPHVPCGKRALLQASTWDEASLQETHYALLSYSKVSKSHRSSIVARHVEEGPFSEEPNAYLLPKGAQVGIVLHKILQEFFEKRKVLGSSWSGLKALIDRSLPESLQSWAPVVEQMVTATLTTSLCSGDKSFTLEEVCPQDIICEPEFLFPEHSNQRVYEGVSWLGFIDLFFRYEGRYYLLDWKSNFLGPSATDYTEERLWELMEEQNYFLQAEIYSKAVERYLGRFYSKSELQEVFGGGFYFFLRPAKALHLSKERLGART